MAVEIPLEYKCPLTLDVMEDPVILVTNTAVSFERKALEACLSLHPKRDPITNANYPQNLTFIPNRGLKDAIERFHAVEAERRAQEERARAESAQQERERAEREQQEQERAEREQQEQERAQSAEEERERAERAEEERARAARCSWRPRQCDLEDFPWLKPLNDNENWFTILGLANGHTFGAEDAAEIATLLEKNTTLTELGLANNNIGPDDAAKIANALEKSTTLKHLDLSNNNIGDQGTAKIASVLGKNSSLETLDLSNNNIGAKGAGKLVTALQKNKALKKLKVGQNPCLQKNIFGFYKFSATRKLIAKYH